VTYWRDAIEEVDFVVSHGTQDWAVEVKSGRGEKVNGMRAFRRRYPIPHRLGVTLICSPACTRSISRPYGKRTGR
jgi:hypothetical protein